MTRVKRASVQNSSFWGKGGREKRRGRGELIAYPGKQHPLERDVPLPGMLHLPRQLRIRVLQPLYRNSPPPSTLTHCPPPPPLHSGHFTWNDNHPRQNDPIASRNNIAKISYNSGKLWTGSSSPFFYFKNFFAILSFQIRIKNQSKKLLIFIQISYVEEIFRGSIIFLRCTYLCLSVISFFNIYIFIEWIHDLFLIFVESFSSVFAFLFYFISFLLVFFY